MYKCLPPPPPAAAGMAAAKAEVREAYVGPAPEGCGLEEAFALSLLDLLSQDRLPANPYFVFANRLITYVDQREFWLKSDAEHFKNSGK